MASCAGCGRVMGFKKYKFHKMWRIPGYYCKPCMIELGKDFDEHAKLTLPTKPCHLCGLDFYFPKNNPKDHKYYCDVCYQSVISGAVPEKGPDGRIVRPVPARLPIVMMIFAGLGVGMMVLGLLFTLSATQGETSLVNILFGATTTALGFLLFKKTIKSRSLLISGGTPRPGVKK